MPFPLSLTFALPRLARIIGLLGLAAALTACSAIKLGYNTLGDVAYWWLDSYVDFTDEQSSRVRTDLARLHGWHRSQELPQVATLLRHLEGLAPGEVTPAQACAVVEQVRERFNALTDRAEPAVVTLALALGPEQLTHLEHKYAKNNAEYRKEWVRLSAAELKEKRLRQFLDRSEMVYGTLGEPQQAALRGLLENSIFDASRMLAERQRRQQDALQTLRKVAGQPIPLDGARSLLRGYLQRAQASPDPVYRRYQQALIEEGCRNMAQLHNSTTPEQRQSAVRRLRAYQRDLQELSAQP